MVEIRRRSPHRAAGRRSVRSVAHSGSSRRSAYHAPIARPDARRRRSHRETLVESRGKSLRRRPHGSRSWINASSAAASRSPVVRSFSRDRMAVQRGRVHRTRQRRIRPPSPPRPRNWLCWRKPRMAATASNSRPALEVKRRIHAAAQHRCQHAAVRPAQKRRRDEVPSLRTLPRHKVHEARRVRRGAAHARRPRRRATETAADERPDGSVSSTVRNSPPQIVPSPPYPVPSQATPSTGPSSPLSTMQARTWAR